MKSSSCRNTSYLFHYLYLFHSPGITRNKYYGVTTKRKKFNCPVVETNGSSEPNDNDLELNAIAYSSLPPFVWFPLRGERGNWNWKQRFLCCWNFTLLWWHLGTQKHVGRATQNRPNRRRSKTFGSSVKTKHQSLASLAFMWLAPGADRVVRHLFIRCIERTGLLHSQLAHID